MEEELSKIAAYVKKTMEMIDNQKDKNQLMQSLPDEVSMKIELLPNIEIADFNNNVEISTRSISVHNDMQTHRSNEIIITGPSLYFEKITINPRLKNEDNGLDDK